MSTFDVIIKGGLVFDGSGADGVQAHVGIKDGCVKAVSEQPLHEAGCPQVVDAKGAWVTPGFIDIHTHYDAELLFAPGLSESVRHGVTTVVTGSCSLSTVYSDAVDCADLFSRVEALPREHVLPALQANKDWDTPAGWVERLNNSALGPNVASLIGHSDIRASVMGLGRSVTRGQRPSRDEHALMGQRLEDALDAGFIGMSTMTNPWDKLDGDRFRSQPLPSTFATWGEYRRLHKVLRDRDRVLQSAPNLNTKVNMVLFFLSSMALPWRKALKTTLISGADPKATPWIAPGLGPVTGWINRFLRADLRWQTLPMPFEIYADGIDLVVFEEFGAGAEAMHLRDQLERNDLLRTTEYRRRFRKDYEKRFSPRVWHRDFHDAHIVGCPDESVVGMTVGGVADQRGIHPADAFLDLVCEYGDRFRWKTVIANHRPKVLERLVSNPHVQIGFSDSGAHLRNMGFYNFGPQLLRMVQRSHEAGRPIMSIGRAVARLTSELAQWFGLDAGTLQVGARADLAIIDPRGLDDSLDGYHEAAMPELGGLRRMVRRNDGAVKATLVGGSVLWNDGAYSAAFGKQRFGRFLQATKTDRTPIESVERAAAVAA